MAAQRETLRAVFGGAFQWPSGTPRDTTGRSLPSPLGIVQRQLIIGDDKWDHPTAKRTDELIRTLRAEDDSDLWKRGWVGAVREMVRNGSHKFATWLMFISFMKEEFPRDEEDEEDDLVARPNFSTATYDLAKATASVDQDEDLSGISLQEEDLAVPHRMPFADLRNNVLLFLQGSEDGSDLMRWTGRLVTASHERVQLNLKNDRSGRLPADYQVKVDRQTKEFEKLRDSVVKLYSVDPDDRDPASGAVVKKFMASLNGLHGNVPDLGPHTAVNIRVSDRVHSNYLPNGTATPGTKAAFAMSPHRISKGIAATSDGSYLVTPRGDKVESKLAKGTPHKLSRTKISESELTGRKLTFSESESESESED